MIFMTTIGLEIIFPELRGVPKSKELILLKMDRDKVHGSLFIARMLHIVQKQNVGRKKCETLSKINFNITSDFSRKFVNSNETI